MSLRALLTRAIESSPFHAARLAGIDAARFELAPHVTICRVQAIDRDPRTGKARRFLPVNPGAA